ncbi:NACHT domain-containing protein [Streptomyces sp. LN549]|uniref:NACHT domain-containing protein n=1 Tax=Streptomyces sp. LN549 TaxID=3112979 RepID=UPI00372297E3
MTEVYASASRPAAPDAHPGPRDDSPLEPAEVVFGNDARISVVIAGPGVGKSTLLRAQVRKAADQWLADKHSAGKRSRPVPVWVSARTLVGKTTHVHEGLAAASDVLPDHGRNPSPHPERFLQLPCAGAHWQLLVDGLDELPNASERRAVLEKLKTAIAEDPPLYRCVVATRPLPHNELGVLGDTASRYELQPFAPEDVHAYVGKYFNTRWPQPEATHRAEEFTSALRGASLAEPARTPLMAFMLCQLYLAQPERPLPAGRSAVYTQFTGLLYLHNKSREVADSHEQAMHHLLTDLQTAKARRKAAAAAKQIHEQLPELIDYLAYQWLTGQPTSAAEAVASTSWPCTALTMYRPRVGKRSWTTFSDTAACCITMQTGSASPIRPSSSITPPATPPETPMPARTRARPCFVGPRVATSRGPLASNRPTSASSGPTPPRCRRPRSL